MPKEKQMSNETKQIIERLKKEISVYLDFVLTQKSDHEVAMLIDYLDDRKIFFEKGKQIKKNIVNHYIKEIKKG